MSFTCWLPMWHSTIPTRPSWHDSGSRHEFWTTEAHWSSPVRDDTDDATHRLHMARYKRYHPPEHALSDCSCMLSWLRRYIQPQRSLFVGSLWLGFGEELVFIKHFLKIRHFCNWKHFWITFFKITYRSRISICCEWCVFKCKCCTLAFDMHEGLTE